MCTGSHAGEITVLSLIEQASQIHPATVLVRRQAIVDAGSFDTSIRSGSDFDLWLRLSLRGAIIRVHAETLVELPPAAGQSERIVESVESALTALQRFDQRHLLDRSTRTALRIRTMRLIDRLEIEQGKCRMLEGHFSAAAFHLSSTRDVSPSRVIPCRTT